MAAAISRALDEIKDHAALADNEIADLLSTTPQTLWRWRRGVMPQRQSRERLLDLRWIVQKLAAVYEPDDANVWLHSRNPDLGGERPVDRIRDGRIQDVLDIVDQLSSGAYV